MKPFRHLNLHPGKEIIRLIGLDLAQFLFSINNHNRLCRLYYFSVTAQRPSGLCYKNMVTINLAHKLTSYIVRSSGN